MRKTTALAFLLGLGVTLAPLAAQAQPLPPDQPTDGPGAGPPPGMRGPGQHLKTLLDKYDVNKDGILDKDELAALKKDIDEGKIPPPPGVGARSTGGQQGPGSPAFHGPPTAKEIIQKYDVDKDGKLDETELTAFLNDMHQHRPPPPRTRRSRGSSARRRATAAVS